MRRYAFVTGGAGFIGSNIVARLAADASLDVVVCDWLGGADEGKPGFRPPEKETWYGAYLRDPTGNKIAIYWTP